MGVVLEARRATLPGAQLSPAAAARAHGRRSRLCPRMHVTRSLHGVMDLFVLFLHALKRRAHNSLLRLMHAVDL